MINECPSGAGRIKDEIPAIVAAETFNPSPLIVDVDHLSGRSAVKVEMVGQGHFTLSRDWQQSGKEGHPEYEARCLQPTYHKGSLGINMEW